MTVGLLGKKCGMTRVFTDDGSAIPVTVIQVLPNRVTQLKTLENDSYCAVQLSNGVVRKRRVRGNAKAEDKHYAKAGVELSTRLYEFRLNNFNDTELTLGSEIKIDHVATIGDFVDVSGVTIGKGFAGTVKRHNFSMKDATHGNSLSHRTPGSIGQRQSPGRVFKGKRMSGHMGAVVRTAMSLKVIKIDLDKNLIMVKGAVPGSVNSDVVIRPAVKKDHNKRGKHATEGK